MNVAKIETFIVEQKLEQPFYFSQWEYDTRRVCLVKITDQDGLYGWGEGYGPAGIVEAGIQAAGAEKMSKYMPPDCILWKALTWR